MSSSDSEAFESADEEIYEFDDKKKVKNKPEENEIKNKEKIPEKKEEKPDPIKPKEEVVKPPLRPYGIPPQRTGCWAGPVKEEAEKRWAELKSKNNDKEKQPPRPEYAVPPKREVCWEEPDQKAAEEKWAELEKNEKKDEKKVEKPFGIPPQRTICWDGPIKEEAEKKWAKEKEERSPSPPDMEQCWEGPDEEAAEKRRVEKKKEEELLLAAKNLKIEEESARKKQEEAAKNLKIENENDGWEFDSWEEVEPVKTEFPVVSNLSPSTEAKLAQPKTSPKFPVKANESLEEEMSESNISNVFDKISKDQSEKQTWGWKPWGGVVNFLSTASEGVANLIGVPDPEEMAKMHHEELKKKKEENPEKTEEEIPAPKKEEGLRLGNIVSGVTQISSRVITGGLDTLEGIGKKTMTMLQENDPGLMNKRKMLGMDVDKPILSQVLREAKEKTEESERNLKQMQKHAYKKQIHFETLFDDYHGLVHLEALEMLSKQSTLRLQSLLTPLTGKALNELQETINEVQELCELPEQENDDSDGLQSVDDLKERFETAVEDLNVPVDFKELLNCWEENTKWLSDLDEIPTPQDIHTKAIHCLAQTTALAVNKMHKLAEVLLVLDHHSTANEADSMVQ